MHAMTSLSTIKLLCSNNYNSNNSIHNYCLSYFTIYSIHFPPVQHSSSMHPTEIRTLFIKRVINNYDNYNTTTHISHIQSRKD